MPAIETIRVSKQGRDQLIRLKRLTGIENWNTLCRWAFCVSIAEPSAPPPSFDVPADSPVEMTWRTFGGQYADLYEALLKHRCRTDGVGLDKQAIASEFRFHLHRGIAYLASSPSLRDMQGLLSVADQSRM